MFKEIIKLSLLVTLLTLGFQLELQANVHMDFDGDGKSDPTLRSSLSEDQIHHQAIWHVLGSSAGYNVTFWGGADLSPNGYGDFFMPADYDGDGKTDYAVWRRPQEFPSSQFGLQCVFYILYSATYTYDVFPWGRSPNATFVDRPAPQDYDGDGKTDIAITRSTAEGLDWYILQSRDGFRWERFGIGGDMPALGDYDGDGKADLAVARGSQTNPNYTFYVQKSSDGTWFSRQLGNFFGDILSPGDYDGDGKTDIAVLGLRGDFPTYVWKWYRSSDGDFRSIRWGQLADRAAAGDYDGDGITDVAIYRISHSCSLPSYFWINGSSTGVQVIQFGGCEHNVIEYYN